MSDAISTNPTWDESERIRKSKSTKDTTEILCRRLKERATLEIPVCASIHSRPPSDGESSKSSIDTDDDEIGINSLIMGGIYSLTPEQDGPLAEEGPVDSIPILQEPFPEHEPLRDAPRQKLDMKTQKTSVEKEMKRIHDTGVCHCDISADNIMNKKSGVSVPAGDLNPCDKLAELHEQLDAKFKNDKDFRKKFADENFPKPKSSYKVACFKTDLVG